MEGSLIDNINDSRGEGGFGYDPIFYLPDYKKTSAEITAEEGDVLELGAYVLNSSNEITKLYTAANIADLDEDYSFTDVVSEKEYDAAAEDINNLYVADSSIILTCKDENGYTVTDRATNYAVASKSYFVDEEEYTFVAITEDD